MDPVSIIGLVSATTGVIEVISRNISFLVELQSRYKSADLKVSLLIGQLSTLKAALEQIGDLMNTSIFDSPCHQPLIQDLRTALDCCEALILILDERSCALRRSEIYGLDFLGRVQFVRDEKGMAEYQNLLNNHINALTLLLTALQWYENSFCQLYQSSLCSDASKVGHSSNRVVCYRAKKFTMSSNLSKMILRHCFG